jgi:hypothetical protein
MDQRLVGRLLADRRGMGGQLLAEPYCQGMVDRQESGVESARGRKQQRRRASDSV